MLCLSQQRNNRCTTEDTYYLSAKLLDFLPPMSVAHLFWNAVQLQYIGAKSYEFHKILADISLALSSLKIISQLRKRAVSLTPDDLFSRFVEFTLSSL